MDFFRVLAQCAACKNFKKIMKNLLGGNFKKKNPFSIFGGFNPFLGLNFSINPQWARKFKNVQSKKTREIKEINFTKNFFDQNPFFAISKIHFWPFWKLLKMEIDLFDFTSFFSWTFFNFLARYGPQANQLFSTKRFRKLFFF